MNFYRAQFFEQMTCDYRFAKKVTTLTLLSAGRDVDLFAGNDINLLSANDRTNYQELHEKTFAGVTVSVSSQVGKAAESIMSSAERLNGCRTAAGSTPSQIQLLPGLVSIRPTRICRASRRTFPQARACPSTWVSMQASATKRTALLPLSPRLSSPIFVLVAHQHRGRKR